MILRLMCERLFKPNNVTTMHNEVGKRTRKIFKMKKEKINVSNFISCFTAPLHFVFVKTSWLRCLTAGISVTVLKLKIYEVNTPYTIASYYMYAKCTKTQSTFLWPCNDFINTSTINTNFFKV